MSRSKKASAVKALQPNIKVKLDSKTIITIKDMAKFEFWKQRYPKAVIVP